MCAEALTTRRCASMEDPHSPSICCAVPEIIAADLLLRPCSRNTGTVCVSDPLHIQAKENATFPTIELARSLRQYETTKGPVSTYIIGCLRYLAASPSYLFLADFQSGKYYPKTRHMLWNRRKIHRGLELSEKCQISLWIFRHD